MKTRPNWTTLWWKSSAVLTALFAVGSSVLAAPSPQPIGPNNAIRKGQEAAYDITRTERGQQSARATSAQWAKDYQVQVDPVDLRVYDFGSGQTSHLLVMPSSAVFNSASLEKQADGTVQLAVDYSVDPRIKTSKPDRTAGRSKTGTSTAAKVLQKPNLQGISWSFQTNGCVATTNNTYGLMNSCWNLYKGTPDGDGGRDFFHLEYWGTAKSKSAYGLTSASVEASASSNGSAQNLGGFEPKEDGSRNCVSVDIGVEAYGFGGTMNHTQCEIWDIEQPTSTYMPRFKNNWRSGSWAKYGIDRSVAMGMATSVPQGGWPVFNLRHAFAVSV